MCRHRLSTISPSHQTPAISSKLRRRDPWLQPGGGSSAPPFRFCGSVREKRCMDKSLTRTICCKLDVDGHDAVLAATQRAFNEAATWIARVCWEEGITNSNTHTAHHRVYGQTRLAYGLGAQLAVCARAKALEAIKAVKAKHTETCPKFGPCSSVRYDARTY